MKVLNQVPEQNVSYAKSNENKSSNKSNEVGNVNINNNQHQGAGINVANPEEDDLSDIFEGGIPNVQNPQNQSQNVSNNN